ncbi:MAG: UvrB/UvrC motif-containing protein [Oscillospiraceae bacterium]|nr:UvrB/UvrC motif-containing protein [Oscillospiraceae bacterium]
MKCQCCGKNEVQQRLYINILGQAGDIGLCPVCIKRLKLYAAGMMDALRPDGPPPEDELSGLKHGDSPFPEDVGEHIRARRRLNELRRRLEAAVAAEDYESAAGLRDEIEAVCGKNPK